MATATIQPWEPTKQQQTIDPNNPNGLIQGAALTPGAAPAPTSYKPTLNTLNPETETVEGRITNIVKNESPLIQQSETDAAQDANAKGLLNSSMAVGAGRQAVYRTALPIASQDTNAALSVSQRNQDTSNRAGEFGATAANQFGMQDVQGRQAMEQQKLRGEQETGLQKMRGEQEKVLQQMRGDQQQALMQTEAQYKTLMQANDSAAKFYAQMVDTIGEVLNNPDLTAEQKDQQIALLNQQTQNGLAVIGNISGVENLDQLLDFSATVTPEETPAETPAEQEPEGPSSGGIPPEWQVNG